MRGFGFVGDPVVGNMGFNEQWSADDWFRQAPATLPQAQANWQGLQDAATTGSPSAAGLMAPFTASSGMLSIPYWITTIDQQTRVSGTSGPTDSNRINAMNKLNAAVDALAHVAVPDPDAEAAAAQAQADLAAAAQAKATADAQAKVAAAAAAAAAVDARRQGTAQAIAAAQAAIAAAAQAAAVAKAAAVAHQQAAQVAVQKSAQVTAAVKTPLIVAAVAIPIAVIAWMALKKSKKSVAGYRRRSRR